MTGSRDWTDAERILDDLTALSETTRGAEPLVLVHGACPTGADMLAAHYADLLGYRLEPHPADWKTYGKRAGFLRNAEMVNAGADVLLAYIKNESKGATMTYDLARTAGIPVRLRRA